MAHATLQTFNVFLTERLTAAAVDIYGFVEKTITDYQDEVYRTKLENQRLQRLLDLVYKPEIRLRRADSRQIDLPTSTQELCAPEKQTQKIPVRSARSQSPYPVQMKLLHPGPCLHVQHITELQTCCLKWLQLESKKNKRCQKT